MSTERLLSYQYEEIIKYQAVNNKLLFILTIVRILFGAAQFID
jgi:hypothetical protein